MQFRNIILLLATAFTLGSSAPVDSQLEERGACGDACVTYYTDGGCTTGLELGSYMPTCTGNCFQFSSFSSIQLAGNIITGVDCIAYSDANCQNEISNSGNQHGQNCLTNLNGAQSMQCFYDC